jgi:hypothetical protein
LGSKIICGGSQILKGKSQWLLLPFASLSWEEAKPQSVSSCHFEPYNNTAS